MKIMLSIILTSPIWLKAAANSNPKLPPNEIGNWTKYNTWTVDAPGKMSINKTPIVITLIPIKGNMSNGFRRPLQSLHGPMKSRTMVAIRDPTKVLPIFTPDTTFWLAAWKQ